MILNNIKKIISVTLLLFLFFITPITTNAQTPAPTTTTPTKGCCITSFDKEKQTYQYVGLKDVSNIKTCLDYASSLLLEKKIGTSFSIAGFSLADCTSSKNQQKCLILSNVSAVIVADYDKQCSTSDQAANSIYSQWCCLPVDLKSGYDKLTDLWAYAKDNNACEPVPKGQKSCPKGSPTPVERNCASISACFQSEQSLKNTTPTTASVEQQLKELQQSAIAASIKPKLQVELPGFEGFSDIKIADTPNKTIQPYLEIPWIAEYIKWIYRYAIGVAGVLAVVLMMIGGFMWILSAGDAGKIGEAKQYITSAVTGLVVVMTTYMILNFVNPDLINLRPLYIEIPNIGIQQDINNPDCAILPTTKHVVIDGARYCADYKDPKLFVKLNDPEIMKAHFLDSNGVPDLIFRTSIPYMTLKGFEGMKKVVKALEGEEELIIASTFRSMDAQVRLCGCWEAFKATNQTVCPPECRGNCNLAPRPRCTGGHGHGTAIDIRLTGKGIDPKTKELYSTPWSCSAPGVTVQLSNCRANLSASWKEKSKPQCESPAGKAPTGYYNCQTRLEAIMKAGGFWGINTEWWHFEAPRNGVTENVEEALKDLKLDKLESL